MKSLNARTTVLFVSLLMVITTIPITSCGPPEKPIEVCYYDQLTVTKTCLDAEDLGAYDFSSLPKETGILLVNLVVIFDNTNRSSKAAAFFAGKIDCQAAFFAWQNDYQCVYSKLDCFRHSEKYNLHQILSLSELAESIKIGLESERGAGLSY